MVGSRYRTERGAPCRCKATAGFAMIDFRLLLSKSRFLILKKGEGGWVERDTLQMMD